MIPLSWHTLTHFLLVLISSSSSGGSKVYLCTEEGNNEGNEGNGGNAVSVVSVPCLAAAVTARKGLVVSKQKKDTELVWIGDQGNVGSYGGRLRALSSSPDRLFLLDTTADALVSTDLAGGDATELVKFDSDADRPVDVAYDRCSGHVYIADTRRGVVQRLDSRDSNNLTTLQVKLTRPSAVAANRGRVFIFDQVSSGGAFRIVTASGAVVCSGKGSASVFSMAAASDGFVYWSDWHNMMVWRVRVDGGQECDKEPVLQLSVRPMGLATSDEGECVSEVLKMEEKSKELNVGDISVALPTPTPQTVVTTSCDNFCLHNATCDETSTGAVCACAAGFSGTRCERDVCSEFCLNSGTCSSFNNGRTCDCPAAFDGPRCEVVSSVTPLLIETLLFTLLTLLLLAALAWLACRNRSLSRRLLAAEKGLPKVVRKDSGRAKTFVANEGRRSCSREEAVTSPAGLNGGGSRTVVDMEDCCQMTLCPHPCVDARARQASHRKNNKKMTSDASCKDGDDAQKSLLESEVLPDGRLDW